jgi:hypothetical protein
MQLATRPNGKRIADDTFSILDTFDLNPGAFQNHTSPHKRARLISLPGHLADEWSWSTATTDDEYQLRTTAATSYPCVPLVSFPDYYILPEGDAACFLSAVSASASDSDMPAKRPHPVRSSDMGKSTPVEKPNLEGSFPKQTSPSNSNKNTRGVAPRRRPRRQPFPGENNARLAATWRETTSSRGAENTFSKRGQEQLNRVTASTSNVSSSGSVTGALESYDDHNMASRGSSSALDFNLIEEQLNANCTGSGGEIAYHENDPSTTEVEQEYPTASIDLGIPSTDRVTAHDYPQYTMHSGFCLSHPYPSFLSFEDFNVIEIPLELGSMSQNAKNASSFQMPGDAPFDFSNLTSDFFEFDLFPPENSTQQPPTHGLEAAQSTQCKCVVLSSNTFRR